MARRITMAIMIISGMRIVYHDISLSEHYVCLTTLLSYSTIKLYFFMVTYWLFNLS